LFAFLNWDSKEHSCRFKARFFVISLNHGINRSIAGHRTTRRNESDIFYKLLMQFYNVQTTRDSSKRRNAQAFGGIENLTETQEKLEDPENEGMNPESEMHELAD